MFMFVVRLFGVILLLGTMFVLAMSIEKSLRSTVNQSRFQPDAIEHRETLASHKIRLSRDLAKRITKFPIG